MRGFQIHTALLVYLALCWFFKQAIHWWRPQIHHQFAVKYVTTNRGGHTLGFTPILTLGDEINEDN